MSYWGRILRIDLGGEVKEEEVKESFLRKYIGGTSLIAYFLMKEQAPKTEPFSEDSLLIFAPGVITGVPVGGCGRNAVGGKSPLTGAFGTSEVGGYWGAELKKAGFDAIVIKGKAPKPVYIYINDGKVEIRDASKLWGRETGEVEDAIKDELGDPLVRIAQIGPAGERLVRFACVINDLHHAAGRTGMGALMGSKNIKAIAVRGRKELPIKDKEEVLRISKWLRDNFRKNPGARSTSELGTAGIVSFLNRNCGLPVRYFDDGASPKADSITGRALLSFLKGRGSCFACPLRCKRIVEIKEPYYVSPKYGGPEYETIASIGSNCDIFDLKAISKGSELCNKYGLDTISTGMVIAFAMKLAEEGIIKEDIKFGDPGSMLSLIEKIARREGIGDILAEGIRRASEVLGGKEFALHIKGQEIPMHEPRFKMGMGMGYAVSTTGADHCHNIHDNLFMSGGPGLEEIREIIGYIEPLELHDLGPDKMRVLYHWICFNFLRNSLCFCNFVPLSPSQLVKLVEASTGWRTSLFDLLKVGERGLTLARLFNMREGVKPEEDELPEFFFKNALKSEPLKGTKINKEEFLKARDIFYEIAGWEGDKIRRGKLLELGIEEFGEGI